MVQGAVLGPDEFLEGMKLGGKQFVGGTIGGISGVLGKVTGVLGDTAAKLTMDDEFMAKRRQGRGGVGQGLEGAAKVCVCVCLKSNRMVLVYFQFIYNQCLKFSL